MKLTQRFKTLGLIMLCAAFMATSVSGSALASASFQLTTPSFTVTDLGTLPGGEYSVAYALSADGAVVGVAEKGNGEKHAFLWEAGKMTDLGTLPGGRESEAVAINGSGQIVGTSTTSGDRLGGSGTRAVLWNDGKAIDLGTLGGDISWASGINDAGQVVGWSDTANGSEHAFLWEAGKMTDLGTINRGRHSRAFGINNAGQVVGRSNTDASQTFEGPGTHAFMWENGRFTDLGTLPGGDHSEANGINEAGQIVGVSNTTAGGGFRDPGVAAFLWDDGTMIELPFVEDAGMSLNGGLARDINDAGQVVGWDVCSCGDFALLWADEQVIDLRDAADEGLTHIYGINESGQIAGYGYYQGEQHATLLTPLVVTPSPTPTGLELGPTPVPTPEQTGVVGNSYLSPTHGVRLSWDSNWEVVHEVSDGEVDQLILTNGASMIELDSGPAEGLALADCVDEAASSLETNADLADLTVGLSASGEPLRGGDPDQPYAVFTATLTIPGELGSRGDAVAFYIGCLELPGDAFFVILHGVPLADFNAQIPELLALLEGIETP